MSTSERNDRCSQLPKLGNVGADCGKRDDWIDAEYLRHPEALESRGRGPAGLYSEIGDAANAGPRAVAHSHAHQADRTNGSSRLRNNTLPSRASPNRRDGHAPNR